MEDEDRLAIFVFYARPQHATILTLMNVHEIHHFLQQPAFTPAVTYACFRRVWDGTVHLSELVPHPRTPDTDSIVAMGREFLKQQLAEAFEESARITLDLGVFLHLLPYEILLTTSDTINRRNDGGVGCISHEVLCLWSKISSYVSTDRSQRRGIGYNTRVVALEEELKRKSSHFESGRVPRAKQSLVCLVSRSERETEMRDAKETIGISYSRPFSYMKVVHINTFSQMLSKPKLRISKPKSIISKRNLRLKTKYR
jgi:hypothetical protein